MAGAVVNLTTKSNLEKIEGIIAIALGLMCLLTPFVVSTPESGFVAVVFAPLMFAAAYRILVPALYIRGDSLYVCNLVPQQVKIADIDKLLLRKSAGRRPRFELRLRNGRRIPVWALRSIFGFAAVGYGVTAGSDQRIAELNAQIVDYQARFFTPHQPSVPDP